MEAKQFQNIKLTSVENEWLNQLNQTIIMHLADKDFNMDFLGEKINLSRRQLQRRIKNLTGKTPKNYIKDLVWIETKRLIRSGEIHTVKELALRVGFSNPEYFSTIFKLHFGEVPSSFLRKRNNRT